MSTIGRASFAGIKPLNGSQTKYATRGDLIRIAEADQSARRINDAIHTIEERYPAEPSTSLYEVAAKLQLAIDGAMADQTLRVEQPAEQHNPRDLR